MLGAFCRISLRFSSGLGTLEDWRLEFLWMLELGAWTFAAPQFGSDPGCGYAALCPFVVNIETRPLDVRHRAAHLSAPGSVRFQFRAIPVHARMRHGKSQARQQ